ncbi:MAG TPA: Ku protein [Terriglobia bacterium]
MPRRKPQAESHPGDEQESSVRPFWSGTLSFGLVSIPVNLYPATRQVRSPIRMLSADGMPLSRRYFSSDNDRELDDSQIVRGYEVSKDKFVVVTDEELARLDPEKSRDIDLRLFVKTSDIEPVYFEHAYYLAPAKESAKAYNLLAETMENSKRAGIATFVMRDRAYLVAILAENGILRAETLRFSDEVRSPADVGLPKVRRPAKSAVGRFVKLIRKYKKDSIAVDELKDEETEKLLKLVEHKRARHKDVIESETAETKPAKVVDLMEVLKKSLAGKRAA